MEIQLDFITGENDKKEDIVITKTFVENHTKAKLIRRAIAIENENNLNQITIETLDIMADFLCDVYHNKFTREELYDGLDSAKLLSTYRETVREVIYGVTSILDTFPEEQ